LMQFLPSNYKHVKYKLKGDVLKWLHKVSDLDQFLKKLRITSKNDVSCLSWQ
jgi:hypothetical protein